MVYGGVYVQQSDAKECQKIASEILRLTDEFRNKSMEEFTMKKNQFIALLVGTVGGLLFSLGMCMCLLPEWNAFHEGVVATAAGAVLLIVLAIVSRIRSGKPRKPINWKVVGKVAYGTLSALVLGAGMCLIMVWNLMLPGIVVGIVGIVMLLCLIPMCIGLK